MITGITWQQFVAKYYNQAVDSARYNLNSIKSRSTFWDDRIDDEDVMLEAVMTALEKTFDNYNPTRGAAPGTLLMNIVRNEVVNELKKANRHLGVSGDLTPLQEQDFTFRQMAEERGVDFWTFCRMAENDYDIDRELDRRQVEMAMKEENCILASRLAVWMLKEADLKVYLTATPETRARRIFNREGGSYEERYQETVRRDNNDTRRYMAIYGIDNSRPEEVADLLIATDDKTPEEIVEIIVENIRKKEGK